MRSGVCLPLFSNGRIIGTMDFFTTEYIDLSESRASALRNVQQLVSQRLDIVRAAEASAENARELLDTVSRLRATSDDATSGEYGDRRRHPDHLVDRRADQPAGPERHR